MPTAYFDRERNLMVCRTCNQSTAECRCLSVSEHPWATWFNMDKDGRITKAGVDSYCRGAGICEVLSENIEVEDVEAWNRYMIGDTFMLGVGPEAMDLLDKCECYCPVAVQDEIRALRKRVRMLPADGLPK